MALFNRPTASDQLKGAWKSLKSGDGLSLKAQNHHSKQVRDARQAAESDALMSYEVLTELLMTNAGSFEVREHSSDGRLNVYRGGDITLFIQRQDDRRHTHEVYDSAGTLLYKRDYNGRVTVGSEKQLRRFALSTNAAQRLLK